MNKLKVTIGIPAFNEGRNITNLLTDISRQIEDTFMTSEIIVASDGSTDDTVRKARAFKDKRIKVISFATRNGVAVMQNIISKYSTGNILVILNADIRILDPQFLHHLIAPIKKKTADLTSAQIIELPAKTFTEQVINVSNIWKKKMKEAHNSGNNVYTCHGAARAFSKKLYKSLHFQDSIGEDAYSYLYTVTNNFSYKYVADSCIYYRSPSNFSDHKKQSVRFHRSYEIMSNIFGEQRVKQEYHFPLSLYASSFLSVMVQYPFFLSVYVLFFMYIFSASLFKKNIENIWEISYSSKKL